VHVTRTKLASAVALSAAFSVVLFLLVQTGLAYVIKGEIQGQADWLLVVGLLLGFNLLGTAVATVTLSLFKIRGIARPLLLAVLANVGLWVLLPFALVYANAGGLVPAGVHAQVLSLPGVELALAIPQLAAVFAVYYLPGVTWFWWLNLATLHALAFALLIAMRRK